ncbi:MAG: CsbD family protein [Azonexus sp.]
MLRRQQHSHASPVGSRTFTEPVTKGCAGAPISQSARPNLFNSGAGLHFGTAALNQFHSQEHTMNKDQAKGRLEEAKGKVKEVTGKLVGNDELEVKGKIQKSGGKAQATHGDLKEDVKDAIKGK